MFELLCDEMKSNGWEVGGNLQNLPQHFTPIYRFCLSQKSTCNYNKKGEKWGKWFVSYKTWREIKDRCLPGNGAKMLNENLR
jgi:hypothetical protein